MTLTPRWAGLGLLVLSCARTPVTPTGADIVGVAVSGESGAYTFDVSVRSDETGCDQYADWWEVLTPEGALLYRRILNHSHPLEQPFTRGGGPVPIALDQPVLIRAHAHPAGFIGRVHGGTVIGGFGIAAVEDGFAADVETVAPLPEGCWF